MPVITEANAPAETSNAVIAQSQRPGGIVRKMGRAVSYLLLLVAAFGALVMVVVPLATGSQTYTVLTNSMAPKYAPGSFLVVRPTPFDNLRVGDVVTYQIESGKPAVISHRIIAVGVNQEGERTLTTKGDNNSLADAAPVKEVQVKGKLLYAIPYVGFAAHAAGQERGALLPIIAVGFLGFGALTMVTGTLEKKRSRTKARHAL
ncbi:signal peptidase I [Arthrobacter sp. GMC3]|uniref:signal peptidase I n=1 Tax=Arthrobacter sp. GMC3 TaxID=2058894 RepID=UPI0021580575|nr:signal peptidase I [Arthrobacter sp. GMC3]